MKELKEQKEILQAMQRAIANMRLEADFKDLTEENIYLIQDKILKLGGYYEKVGGLFNRRN